MSLANPLWGAPRLHGELLKLGIDLCVPKTLSDSDHASIDEQFDRVDEAAVVRGEKYDGFGDFVRFARAPQRDLGGHLGGKPFDLFFGQAALVVGRRDNYPWAHRVDADLVIFQIIGPATGEIAHRRLGSGIDAEVWHAL